MFVGGTGATLFVAGGLVFRSRNASQLPPPDFQLDGRTFVVTVSRGEGAGKKNRLKPYTFRAASRSDLLSCRSGPYTFVRVCACMHDIWGHHSAASW
jgi:hypothetical protein